VKKDKSFLIIFSLLGYALYNIVISRIGQPFSEIKKAWVALLYNLDYQFSNDVALMALINTIILIVMLTLFLYSIRRFLINSNSFKELPKFGLNIIFVFIVFLVIDLALVGIFSLLPEHIASVFWLTESIGLIIKLLYFISLAIVVCNGSYSLLAIKLMRDSNGFWRNLIIAMVLLVGMIAIPLAVYNITASYMPDWWYSPGRPLLDALAFTVVISICFNIEHE